MTYLQFINGRHYWRQTLISSTISKQDKLERVPTFEYNSRKKKIYIDLQSDESLYFNPKLATMLGITTNPIHSGNESI